MEYNVVRDLHKVLVQSWSIRPVEEGADSESLLAALTERVGQMIEHDLNRFLTAMYTLDVSEARVSEALGHADRGRSARAIAELILERELEKIESRRLYERERDASRGNSLPPPGRSKASDPRA